MRQKTTKAGRNRRNKKRKKGQLLTQRKLRTSNRNRGKIRRRKILKKAKSKRTKKRRKTNHFSIVLLHSFVAVSVLMTKNPSWKTTFFLSTIVKKNQQRKSEGEISVIKSHWMKQKCPLLALSVVVSWMKMGFSLQTNIHRYLKKLQYNNSMLSCLKSI